MKNPVISYGVLVIGVIVFAVGIVLLKLGNHAQMPYGATLAAKAKSEGIQPEAQA
jgi:hypothetical protein